MLHFAILSCQLAHLDPRTGACFPSQEVMAALFNVRVRTVRRGFADLLAWGAVEPDWIPGLMVRS